MAAYLPKFAPGQAVTYTASADVVGGRLVAVTGDRLVAHATAASLAVVGVAGVDAKEGAPVVVYSGGVQTPLADGAITAGALVGLAADGCVSEAGPIKIGVALEGAATGEKVAVHMGALVAPEGGE